MKLTIGDKKNLSNEVEMRRIESEKRKSHLGLRHTSSLNNQYYEKRYTTVACKKCM